MRTWAKGSAPAALLAVAVMALSSGTALADTSGTASVGGGNQVDLPVKLPVDISGNAVGVIGGATAGSRGGASVQEGGASDAIQGHTDGSHSVLGGNQVNAPITAPISACGNAVSLIGRSDAGCRGGAEVKKGKDATGGAGGNTTDGRHSVLGGNQIVAPITAPISACGNAVAVIGEAAAGCRGGAKAVAGGGRQGAGGNRTDGRGSVLGGNQVVAPITAPVSVCGNAVAVIGHAFAGCRGGATVPRGGNGYGGQGHGGRGGAGGNTTDGRHSVLGGNQIVAPITAPVNVCGNAVGNGAAGCPGGVSAPPAGRGSGAGGNRTSGYGSVLGGNQVVAPITAPVSVCGVSAGVLGRAFSGCRGGATIKGGGGGAGNNRTDGRHSVLGGNQVVAPITAPVSVCGNAVAVLGDAAAGCLGGASVGGKAAGVAQQGPGTWARGSGAVSAAVTEAKPSGLLPELPLTSALPGRPKAGETTHQSGQAGGPGSPATSGREKPLGLPELPVTPGRPAPSGGDPLIPVKRVVSGTPVGGVIGGARSGADASPVGVGTLGLMSAERPLGVTGMNAGSLAALLTGALFAASAILFAGTRRLRRR
ncbi:hypothetical protein Ssi03_72410 [Sphaerisporangium siamense]|uniref:Chaplin domain-containing protein n=1 Tax=Sphaerisporangium siamense TaxID=795645 RepID=A0A7W7G9V4_9ACTN|nr:chaplin family protein [Sphaerisporangium siamense]MBB4699341.1 hypothetical protein [Sphaerisporangium siamense]GII89251.1 hypothetical protein Ssi03_72410 [Sphaerisporangium siamense]